VIEGELEATLDGAAQIARAATAGRCGWDLGLLHFPVRTRPES